MINTGVISYGTGTFFFLVLSLVLLTGQQGRKRKNALKFAAIVSTFWLGIATFAVYHDTAFLAYLVEPVRSFAWLLFLGYVMVSAVTGKLIAIQRFHLVTTLVAGFTMMLLVLVILRMYYGHDVAVVFGIDLLFAGFLLMAIAGLVMVEQIMRNAHVESRRAVKYLCIGLGVILAYDFYLYSNALLFQALDPVIWQVRGFVNAMAVPVLGVAIARDPRLSLDIFVSRRMVFHTTALLGTGMYLLAMGLGGYYIRAFGGEWGTVVQVIFLFGAGLVLLVLLFSGRVRASLRVFINKHFFHYKYDYRDEWLRFIQTLSSGQPDNRLRERTIHSLAEIIDSPGGVLWMRQITNRFVPVASWQMEASENCTVDEDHPLVQFMASREWLIDLDECERDPELYNNLTIPGWLKQLSNAWLVVPLIVHDHMLGFIVLARSPAQHHFNWEDSDLIKTAGRQAAVHLAQLEASRSLAEAQQFEACNRLSTYVMHDLKNLIAQLSLVVTNAAKHRNNPQFMEDAINTVDNSVQKMNRLLSHLRSDAMQSHEPTPDIELCGVLGEVIETMSGGKPVPSLDCQAEGILLSANRERFSAVIGHIIRNAQEATPDDGQIIVRLFKRSDRAIIEVQDTGIGMDKEFIRNRLFKPFDSTKGKSGMGIGVYESRDYVHRLGGDIEVISRVGEGTTFRIRLPISDAGENDVKLNSEKQDTHSNERNYKEIAGY
ncbi:MAG: PEP-CTERM system histidine kinase PrsK [Gammaproteobacteria bacterium]|nr:MAG: PEP-CTERM system histidine kinase PrsK [Gammaproteobacteria bacterium]